MTNTLKPLPADPTDIDYQSTTQFSPNDRVGSAPSSVDNEIAAQTAEFPPRIKIVKIDGIQRIVPDHPDQQTGWTLLMKALRITSPDLVMDLLEHIAEATEEANDLKVRAINSAIAMITAKKPRDYIHTMLLVDTYCFHRLFAWRMRLFNHSICFKEEVVNEGILNRVTKNYVSLANALNNYERRGEYQVLVQTDVSPTDARREFIAGATQNPGHTLLPNGTAAPAAIGVIFTPMPLVELRNERAEIIAQETASTSSDPAQAEKPYEKT